MKHCILVVEDNLPSRELLSDWLALEGFDAVQAESYEEAFQALNHRQIDAVLLDVHLGPEDGLSLAKWIRDESSLHHIPVIAVTAHAMVTDQQRMIHAGCRACISKPVDFRLLKQQLQKCLSQTRI